MTPVPSMPEKVGAAVPGPGINLWALAFQQAEHKNWHAAVASAESALAEPGASAGLTIDGLPTTLVSALLAAARWAQSAEDGGATKRLALKAMLELERGGAPTQETSWIASENLRECIDFLATLVTAEDGAAILDEHPDLFARCFEHPFCFGRLVESPRMPVYSAFSLRKGETPLTLAQWCMARGRPNWALSALSLAANDADDGRAARVEHLTNAAAASQQGLKRQVNLLSGPLRLAQDYSRAYRWLAWPGQHKLLFGQVASDDGLPSYTAPPASKLQEVDGYVAAERELDAFLDNCREPRKDGKPNWTRRDESANLYSSSGSRWWNWCQGTTWLSLASSPLPWLIVWLLPLAMLVLYMGLFAEKWPNVHQALAMPVAWAMAFLVWSLAGWRCRVIRFLRIEATYGRAAWIAVPIPVHKLAMLETDVIDAMRTDEHTEDFLDWLKVERIGDFISVGGVHHRLSAIRMWGLDSVRTGLITAAFGLGAAAILPVVAFAAIQGFSYFQGVSSSAEIWAIPVFAVLLTVIGLSLLGALGALFATIKVVATGFFRQVEHRIGYFDEQGKFRCVSAHYSDKTAKEVFSRLQAVVSGTTK